VNVFSVAETLMNHINSKCPNDIAIAAYYGSYAQGTASKRSDLDFFFIPATPDGYNVSIQFVLGEISFDFWPISWERAKRMSSFQEPTTTIIADSKLFYVRSDEDFDRFMKLRDTISVMQEPEHEQELVEKAESHLRNAYVHLHKMSLASESENIAFFRIEAHCILTNVLQSLALLNRTYFTKGWGKNTEQILQLPLKPANLESKIDAIIRGKVVANIRDACTQLTADTVELFLNKRKNYSSPPTYPDRMKGYYEEIKGVLDKILTACETKDYSTAFFWTIHAQDEISRFLYCAETGHWPSQLEPNLDYQDAYTRAGLPSLVVLLDPNNFTPLQVAVEQLNSLLEKHLRDQGVAILRFQTIGQFEEFLSARRK